MKLYPHRRRRGRLVLPLSSAQIEVILSVAGELPQDCQMRFLASCRRQSLLKPPPNETQDEFVRRIIAAGRREIGATA